MKNSVKNFSAAIWALLVVATTGPACAWELFNPVPGFLVPTAEAIPPGYTEFIHTVRHNTYAYQYDRWVQLNSSNRKPVRLGNGVNGLSGTVGNNGRLRDAQILISEYLETPERNFDSDVRYFENDKRTRKLKEFTFQGSNGVIFETSNPYQTARETYELFWKDGNRVLHITNVFEQKDNNFSSDSLIDMLVKFKRAN